MGIDGHNLFLLKSSGDLPSKQVNCVKGPSFPVCRQATEMG